MNACKGSGPDLGSAQLAGDEWNLGGDSTAGSVGMSVGTPGGLAVSGDLSSAPPCTRSACVAPSANTWVRGYPSVSYGLNQCDAKTSPPESPHLRLPVKVAALPSDLVGTTTYAADTSQVTYDIAYDMWLNASGTTTPCRSNGTLEVMVWTDYDARALLPQSMQVGTVSVPFAVDGSANPGTEAWTVYASNVYQAGRTAPWGGTVWLVLNGPNTISKGTVSVDLSAALTSVGTLLQENYGWRNFQSTYWLDTVPFGIEYGPGSGGSYSADPIRFSMDLSSYCLGVATSVSKAGC